ncbi:MAG: putative enzyme related to lactoylglutathione lyase [Paracoccaceae bacterium]|jgi:predicted enzyme related to lactoylglutathione lyase
MSTQPQHAVAWSEIPVTDMKNAVAFYNEVFGYTLTIDESGPNPMAMYPDNNAMGVCGHLYPGKPATDGQGPTVHLAIPDKIEAAMERVKAAGGAVRSPIVTIPPGRFAYIQDLDGNSIALFEFAGS